VSNYVVDSYVRLRKISKDEEQQNKSHSYTSARTLLAVLRLAQALARLRFSDTVSRMDVDEALRLMEVSKASLQEDGDKEYEPDMSATSQIFRLIKGMMGEGNDRPKKKKRLGRGPGRERDMEVDSDEDPSELAIVDIRARVLQTGYTEVQLNEAILQVWLRFLVFHTIDFRLP
jgi:DNA replication licensing factor MCM7